MMRAFAMITLMCVVICGTSNAYEYARDVTTVSVAASAWDERTSGEGCTPPNGCYADNTYDDSLDEDSRWSCKEELEDAPCLISYIFGEQQHIVGIYIAFHKGDERTRQLEIRSDGDEVATIESGGETESFESFDVATILTKTLTFEAVGLDPDEWISILETRILVYTY